MRPITLLAVLAITSPAVAQDLQQSPLDPLPGQPRLPADWEPTSRLNSAGLAAAGMENTGTAALSLLDGQHAIVTFWTAEVAGQVGQSLAFRCVTFFDEDLVETGETCDQAVYLRQ